MAGGNSMPKGSTPQNSDTPASFELDAIHLQIGARLQLITEQSGRPQNYFATLVGYLAGAAVLVRTPTENGLAVAFHEGEPLTVRVFAGIHVYSFKTFVDRILVSPFPCLCLAFPKMVSGVALRKAMRVKVNIPAQATRSVTGEAPQSGAVSLTNLSIVGALVESELQLGQVQEEIEISFTFVTQPGDREVTVRTRAAIRNLRAPKADSSGQPGLYTHGVEFLNLEPTERVMVQNLIYEAFVSDRKSVV
jgi:c-di-GMP-binding flagellar brake protein YcgR